MSTRCDTAACFERGYHRVPVATLSTLSTDLIDPMIGQLFGRFLVIGHIGSGGIGAVYLALSQPGGRKVALKVLNGKRGPHSAVNLDRFRQEAAALARVDHPKIVELVEFGEDEGRAYLVMDYVARGRTLAAEMRKNHAEFPLAARFDVLCQVVQALDAAHAQQVVHRDIKPANIMLQSVEDEPWRVRIVDFGLAKFIDDGSSTALMAGTPTYMAPEQVTQSGIGPWTDRYAVAVIAYEMLAGRRPFPGNTPQQVMLLKMQPDFDFLAQTGGALPEPARAFFRRALAVDPRARHPASAPFVHAMEAAFRSVDPLLPPGRRPDARDTIRAALPAAMPSLVEPTMIRKGGLLPAPVRHAAPPAPEPLPDPSTVESPEKPPAPAVVVRQIEPSAVRPARARPLVWSMIGLLFVATAAGTWALVADDSGPAAEAHAVSDSPSAAPVPAPGAAPSPAGASGDGGPEEPESVAVSPSRETGAAEAPVAENAAQNTAPPTRAGTADEPQPASGGGAPAAEPARHGSRPTQDESPAPPKTERRRKAARPAATDTRRPEAGRKPQRRTTSRRAESRPATPPRKTPRPVEPSPDAPKKTLQDLEVGEW